MSSEIDLAKALGKGGNEELVRHLLMRFSQLLPPLAEDFDWTAPAYRWVKRAYLVTELGRREPVHAFASVDIDRLLYVERQKNLLLANTEAFVKGLPANNVLLTGARGTGKSSLIRGCASRFFDQGLRLIEVATSDLVISASICLLNWANAAIKRLMRLSTVRLQPAAVGFWSMRPATVVI